MSDSTLNLTPELYAYLQQVSLRENDVLRKLREQTHKMSMSQMQVSPEQGQLMRFLVELMGAKRIIELGVFTGYSTLSMAMGLPEEGYIIACDINVEWTKIAKKYWDMAGVASKIDLRLAPALCTLQALLDQGMGATFDLIFIDADKANYIEYYEKSLQLLRSGGLMLIDNVLWSGKVADLSVIDANTKIIRQLNEKIHQDQRVSMTLLPIGDGLTLARKR